MKFDKVVTLLLESVLGDKDVRCGPTLLQVKLVKHDENEDDIRIIIKSLIDASKTGYISFDNKMDAILSYENLTTEEDIVAFMTTHRTNPTAFSWQLLLNDINSHEATVDSATSDDDFGGDFTMDDDDDFDMGDDDIDDIPDLGSDSLDTSGDTDIDIGEL